MISVETPLSKKTGDLSDNPSAGEGSNGFGAEPLATTWPRSTRPSSAQMLSRVSPQSPAACRGESQRAGRDDFANTRYHNQGPWLVANGTADPFLTSRSFTTTRTNYAY